jgi:Protein of unknown function (DUF2877)
VIAHTVAAPVAGRKLRVTHVSRHAGYADLEGFVVVVVGPGGPLLPNGVVLTGPPEKGRVVLEGAEVWDPTLRLRGDESLAAPGDAPLAHALRDPALAAEIARGLIGRGPGLTPEGDDAVAVTAAIVAAGGADRTLLAALLPEDLRARTTALSATLLELAAQGMIAEPFHAVLNGAPLERLTRLGHTTGRTYAVNGAAALRGLGYGARHGARDQGHPAGAGAVDFNQAVARAGGRRRGRAEVAADRP